MSLTNLFIRLLDSIDDFLAIDRCTPGALPSKADADEKKETLSKKNAIVNSTLLLIMGRIAVMSGTQFK